MRRVAFAVLCSFLFASVVIFASPATAGGYYGGGYYGDGYYGGGYYGGGYHGGGYYGHYPHVWYSSRCCYRKIIRHERIVHFERLYRPYYHGYYGEPHVGYYAPHRYVDYGYGPYGYRY